MIFDFLKRKKGGFFVLTMVLLVGAVVLIVAVGILLRAISDVNKSADSEMSLKAWSTVNACGEYALWNMSTTSYGLLGWDYASTTGESLDVGGETCYIYMIEDGENGSKMVKASSTVSKFTKKILIEVATNTPSLVVNSWIEVADF